MKIRFRQAVVGAAVLGAAAAGGALAASAITDDGSTSTEVVSPAADDANANVDVADDQSGDQADGDHDGDKGPHGEETPLTGDDLAKATAAAQAAVPGATVDRAETDADGGTYEVHMTQPDGTHVTVTLDANFVVTDTETRD